MTEYAVGLWYGWNGDDCPVHPLSIVQAAVADGRRDATIIEKPAGQIRWVTDSTGLDTNVIAFRVIEEYVMPREYYLEIRPTGSVYKVHFTKPNAVILADNEIIRVMEQK